MPRPSVAQLVYGTITVICSAAAMLLLTQAQARFTVFAICLTALALGLLVAVTAPGTRRPTADPLPEAAPLPRVTVPAQERAVAGQRDAA
ncbi:hypothetical protein SRB5_41330 [Streptomyces sp. RB5]|uniref:Uncharacterized protein n=1 Tax=Streptomyces smaragdinus TaxID=2585196 RepID=A0A7K0CL33_9ACTN|nr:hypothetical protein [Streptomyces smaragdinus]MQY13973.1 hypothetical protein [Streptomyces smaragdinus]